jgi:hypothetical protein
VTRHERPIPADVLRCLLGVILALTVVTALSNFGHGRELATYAGQDDQQARLAAAVPDVLIGLGITVLVFRHRNPWAWCCLTAGVAFLAWSGYVTALPGFCTHPGTADCGSLDADAATRVGVALWPLLAAVILAGLGASLLHGRAPQGVTLAADLKAPGKTSGGPQKRPRTAPGKQASTNPQTHDRAGQKPDEAPREVPATNREQQPIKEPAVKASPADRIAYARTLNDLRRVDAIKDVTATYRVSPATAERDVDTARKALQEAATS